MKYPTPLSKTQPLRKAKRIHHHSSRRYFVHIADPSSGRQGRKTEFGGPNKAFSDAGFGQKVEAPCPVRGRRSLPCAGVKQECRVICEAFRSSLLLGSLAIILLAASACQPTSSTSTSPPNVLFIMVDDLGWKDVGFMGGDFFETPHIDRLAAEGMVFTRSYAGAANCAPSRACFLSGLNTPRHGIYTVSTSDRGKASDRRIIPTPNTTVLADSFFTLPELFKQAGYVTASMGKWHLGPDPTTQGIDVNVAGSHRGNPGRDGYFSPYVVEPLEDGPEGEHLTDRLTTEAIAFLQQHRERAFFLYLPYYSVHTPLLAKDSLIEKYRQKAEHEGNALTNPIYAAMVETLDTNVGRLLQALEALGLAANTLVVFTSDNGGIRAVSPQTPLRAGKGSYYEGGIRVPTAIRWPGQIAAGTTYARPVVNLDFYPTFREILQLPAPDLLDGQSLLPVFRGDTLPERPLFWHFPIYLQAYDPQKDDGRDPLFRTRPGAVAMKGDWKLHQYFEDGGLELYHLAQDPGERTNLLDQHPEQADELHQLLLEWHAQTRAPIPTAPNPLFQERP